MSRNTKLQPVETFAEGISPCIMFSSCSGLHGIIPSDHPLSTYTSLINSFGLEVDISPSQFGKAIVCSDASAEAARYGFTAADRPEGFLVLAIASLGDNIMELKSPPEDTKSLEQKKVGVKGLGRMKTDESEHFVWKDDIKVPCGSLVQATPELKESILDFNEYAVYDPRQVHKHRQSTSGSAFLIHCSRLLLSSGLVGFLWLQVKISFLVGVKYEEKDVEMTAAE